MWAGSRGSPGCWETIGGRRYVDGGVRSAANVYYARGADRVLVLVAMGTVEPFPGEQPLERAVAELRAQGAGVVVVAPDEASRVAMGDDPLDPATHRPAAEAGRAQGRGLTLAWRPA